MMFVIMSHDLVTLESKATFNSHCSFSFNEASDFSKDSSIIFKPQYGFSLKDVP